MSRWTNGMIQASAADRDEPMRKREGRRRSVVKAAGRTFWLQKCCVNQGSLYLTRRDMPLSEPCCVRKADLPRELIL